MRLPARINYGVCPIASKYICNGLGPCVYVEVVTDRGNIMVMNGNI